MSSSRPVPACRWPKSGVAYQSLYQGVAACPEIANEARCGSSPSAGPAGPTAGPAPRGGPAPSPAPAGPNAVTRAGVRVCTAAAGLAEGAAAGLDCATLAWTLGVIDGAGLDWRAGRWLVASAARWVLP